MKNITISTKPSLITSKWYIIDAEGQTLGRLATRVAKLLIGKNKPYFGTNLDCGDHVVVINSSKIKVTGKKLKQKKYYTYSGYQSGLKVKTLEEMNAKNPTKSFELAIKGMLPKSKLNMITKLHVFADANHKHEAQQPELLK